MQLQIEAVHQPQRLELVLGDFIAQAAADLVLELGDAGVDDRLVILVVTVHQMASRSRGRLGRAKSGRTLGPTARTRSRVVVGHPMAGFAGDVDQRRVVDALGGDQLGEQRLALIADGDGIAQVQAPVGAVPPQHVAGFEPVAGQNTGHGRAS